MTGKLVRLIASATLLAWIQSPVLFLPKLRQ